MRKLFVLLVLSVVMMLVSRAGGAPFFSGSPGYMTVPVVTIDGDPSAPPYGITGIQGLALDNEGTTYLFGQNQYILKKEWGSAVEVIYDYGSFVWGSFVRLRGGTLYFGESTTGTIKSIPAAGGTATDLFTLANNYDCAFDSQTRMFLSANPSSSNQIYAWWSGLTEPQLVANVGDYSGPLVFDNNNSLYYGRAATFFAEDIVYFTADQINDAINAGSPLTSSDWTVYAAGLNAPGGLSFDENTSIQDLFVSSSGFGTLSRVSKAGTDLIGTGTYPSSLAFLGAGGLGAFVNTGAALAINCTDYDDTYDSTAYMIKPCPQNFIIGSGDYSGIGFSDIAIFRPETGLWAIRDLTRVYFGGESDLPIAGDYDGDGISDLSVYRPDDGLWAARNVTRFYFGGAEDIPLPRDYDGDGTDDSAIFRQDSGLWAVRGVTRVYFGTGGDFPQPDYTGNGAIVIFRPSTGLWAIRNNTRFYFGTAGDLPVPGDYDGDGTTEAGIYRPDSGLWAIRGFTRIYFGSGEKWDTPLSLCYQETGVVVPSIFRPSIGLWAIRGVTRVYFGREGDFPASR